MNNNDEMTPQQLLNAALDGELDPLRGERLASLLADNPDFRSDYAMTASIRRTTLASIPSFKPAAELTKATFDRIGITEGMAVDESKSSTSNSTRVPAFFHRSQLPLLIVISSSILVMLLLFVLFFQRAETPSPENTSPPASTYTSAAPQNAEPSAGEQANLDQNGPVGMSGSTEYQSVSKQSGPHRGIRSDIEMRDAVPGGHTARDAMEETGSGMGREAAVTTSRPGPDAVSASSNATATVDPGIADGLRSRPAGHFDVSTDGEMHIDPAMSRISSNVFALHMRGDGRVRIYLNGFSMQSFPSTSVPMRSEPFIRNMSIGVAWMISPDHSLGVTFGQEGFPQKYDGRENDAGVHYEQNLLTQWIAATYRAAFPVEFLPFGIAPFVNVSGGATLQAWPLLRAAGGLQWSPAGNLMLSVGIEGGTMLYTFQSSWFATNKLGVVYGVSYVF
jgi:hypothetical protein